MAELIIDRPNAAGSVDNRRAALELSTYALQGGNTNATVREYQARMGSITPDGVRGNATNERMNALFRSA